MGRSLNNIDIESNDMKTAILSFIPTMIDRLKSSMDIERKLESLILGVHFLLERKLSPLIVDGQMLNKALLSVEKKLKERNNNFEIVHKNLHYYYNAKSVLFASLPERLYIYL